MSQETSDQREKPVDDNRPTLEVTDRIQAWLYSHAGTAQMAVFVAAVAAFLVWWLRG